QPSIRKCEFVLPNAHYRIPNTRITVIAKMTKPAPENSRWFSTQHKLAPYLFISPFLITFLVFGCYPILQSLWLSLHATNGPKSHVFVGLSNYQFLIGDSDFRTAVWNTLVYAFWSVF